MAYNEKIRGIHLDILLQDHYQFRHPKLPVNIENYYGISEGTVNSNYFVELQMQAGSEPDAGRRSVIVTMFEPGGADAVPLDHLNYYTNLIRHIGERSLDIYTQKDQKRIRGWIKAKYKELSTKDEFGLEPSAEPNAFQKLMMMVMNPEPHQKLMNEFADWKRDEGIAPVRFRVPLPFHAAGYGTEYKQGPLHIDFTYKLLDGGSYSRAKYKELSTHTETKRVVVTPFLRGTSPSEIIAGQRPDSRMEDIQPEEFLDKGRSPIENIRKQHIPLRICYRVGQALAAFHTAASDDFHMTLENRVGVDKWNSLMKDIKAKGEILEKSTGEAGLYNKILNHVKPLVRKWKDIESGLPKGQIHGDLFPDNVILSGLSDKTSIRGSLNVGIIDPWAAATDKLLFDIGIAISAWCTTKDSKLIRENSQAFLKGYDSVRQRTPLEVENTMLAAAIGSARFAITRAHMHIQDRDEGINNKLRSPTEYLNKSKLFKTLMRTRPNLLEPSIVNNIEI